MNLSVYLAGEIHTNWRKTIIDGCKKYPISFHTPVTDHDASDEIGIRISGEEDKPFWKDHKSGLINTARIKLGIENADIVVVKFGEKYRQWNAAFDAGQAYAMGKPYIIIHPEEYTHALKEVDAHAMAVVKTEQKVVELLEYLSCKE